YDGQSGVASFRFSGSVLNAKLPPQDACTSSNGFFGNLSEMGGISKNIYHVHRLSEFVADMGCCFGHSCKHRLSEKGSPSQAWVDREYRVAPFEQECHDLEA